MSKNRYKYSWNEFDCIEKVIDTQTHKVYHGCEIAVKLLNKQHKRIADLEKELQEWQDGAIIAQWQDCEQRVKDLERQLAESEKAHMEAMENALNDFLTLRQELNQAKTDFALEQLEQMKEKLEVLLKNTEKELNSITDFEFHNKVQGSMKGYMDSINIIDQQIQELRGQQ